MEFDRVPALCMFQFVPCHRVLPDNVVWEDCTSVTFTRSSESAAFRRVHDVMAAPRYTM
jgi:hypothetical protein